MLYQLSYMRNAVGTHNIKNKALKQERKRPQQVRSSESLGVVDQQRDEPHEHQEPDEVRSIRLGLLVLRLEIELGHAGLTVWVRRGFF